MDLRSLHVALLAAAIGTVSACDSAVPMFPLNTLSDPTPACRDVGFVEAVLRGGPDDPRLAWLDFRRGGRREAIWPIGYTARFRPGLEILDAGGMVVLREGNQVAGGCVTRDPNVYVLLPPFT